MNKRPRKTTKIILDDPTHREDAEANIMTALEWGRSYLNNLTKYINDRNLSAGKRARASLYNLKGNSGVINRSMKLLDGRGR